MKNLLHFFIRILLRFRYRITSTGLDNIQQGNRPILFLPNHPALIDPVIVMSLLCGRFQPRPLADEGQISRGLRRKIATLLRTIIIPDLTTGGRDKRKKVEAGIEEVIQGLQQGDNILLYPGGRLMQGPTEELGANSAVWQIISRVPEVQIVLLRTTGLWGSSFSRAEGIPALGDNLKKQLVNLLASGLFFMPKRSVHIEIAEATDLDHYNDKMALNKSLENFYNAEPQDRVEVPYRPFRGKTIHYQAENTNKHQRDTGPVPASIKKMVYRKLRELSGAETISESDHLARDLAMDSLVLVEFGAFLNEEYGVSAEHLDGLQTVADCMLAASGIMPESTFTSLVPPSPAWLNQPAKTPLLYTDNDNVAKIFLEQASKTPDQVIISDQVSGEKTYRQIIMAILALLPQIRKIPGKRVGIMLPASVGAVISYFSLLFAGREPVMVNWTTGSGQIDYCLKSCKVSHVITSKKFTDTLTSRGTDLSRIHVHWVHLETVAQHISRAGKLWALVQSRLSWKVLQQAKIAKTAAILFTSGSESHPKSVPLSHANFLANGQDVSKTLSLHSQDRLLGILPVFHSLGLAGTVLLPLCTGLKTIYWPNPTEGRQLAKLIASHKVTSLITTPTFLQNILHQANEEELSSLRLVFSGAEKCPEPLFNNLHSKAPGAVLCEGYGVTECSPVISINSPNAPVTGTIGYLLPSMEAVLLHPESKETVKNGQPGRLLVRGPNVFSGYIGKAPSPFVLHNNKKWYDTGDLVTRQQDGLITFAGRLKRFVKLGGEMISLPAIEEVLNNALSPNAAEPMLAVTVQGDERPELTLVITDPNISRQQANKALQQAGLSPLHNIRTVIHVSEIPLLGSGKIDYQAIATLVNTAQLRQ